MQDKQWLAFTDIQNALIQVLFLPSGELFRLVLGQVRLHRKVCLWQIECLL